ncbi:CesT family type III secretion system chaperone [Thalassoglobus sp. JC818]|uniref:CesT family type III secretion system chaperone n=1 Tax=Thalassoglobus sp. JC818 TaxID=3232136 RepID=UPI003459D80A
MTASLDTVFQHLSETLGIDDLIPEEDGRYRMQFDQQLDVSIRIDGRSTVILESALGPVPDDEMRAEHLLKQVLGRSLLHFRRCRDVVCYEPESEQIVLQRSFNLDDISISGFHEQLEEFLNTLEPWRNLIKESDSPSIASMPLQFVTP